MKGSSVSFFLLRSIRRKKEEQEARAVERADAEKEELRLRVLELKKFNQQLQRRVDRNELIDRMRNFMGRKK